jgi:hypothetical protein
VPHLDRVAHHVPDALRELTKALAE